MLEVRTILSVNQEGSSSSNAQISWPVAGEINLAAFSITDEVKDFSYSFSKELLSLM